MSKQSGSVATVLMVAAIFVLGGFSLATTYFVNKNQNIYNSKAAENTCKDGINSVSTNIAGDVIPAGSFECRVNSRDQNVTNIACGYYVNNEGWPGDCPWSAGGRWDGNTAVFPCNPAGEGVAAGSTLKMAAVRDGSCWGNKDNIVFGPTYSFISKGQNPTATSVPTATGRPPTATGVRPPTATVTQVPRATATPIVGYCGRAPVPTVADGRFTWTALCDKRCTVTTAGTDCPKGVSNGNGRQDGWCYGFDDGFKCLRFDLKEAPVCGNNNVNMTVNPNPATLNQPVTFSLSKKPSTDEGDVYVDDTWSGGVNCEDGFWPEKTCKATATGNFTWTHKWRKCIASTDLGNCTTDLCSSSTTFTVNSNVQPTNTPVPTTTSVPTATVTPVPTATGTTAPTTTATVVPSRDVALNLKLKFQGISSKPPDDYNRMIVKVSVIGGLISDPPVFPVAFTANNNGVWSGSISFKAKTGDNYKYAILIKGPKHLQKRICNADPSEEDAGTYRCSGTNIILKEGDNNLDFSRVLQLAGDLPEQNGIINSADLSRIVNCLGKNDADCVGKADVNLDGVVNAQDYSFVIQSLSIKFDEQ